ncbi:MAG: N-acetylglucosamine-6-phosphate deacetylase [Beutenbergiaceae bacterium]
MIVRGQVVTPETVLTDGVVAIDDGVISWVGSAHDARAAGLGEQVGATEPDSGYVLPGLVDLHNHGGGGASFPDATDLDRVRVAVNEHRDHGTTGVVASLVTAAPDTLAERVSLLADAADAGEIAGIHLEGPFLSVARCGAQDPELIIAPDAELTSRLLRLGRGHVVTMTVAPEQPGVLGSDGVVAALIDGGALPSWGHTDSSASVMRQVLGATSTMFDGARSPRATVTHLCNGMPPMHHRNPGPVPVALAAASNGDVVVELVADGTHLAPELVAEVFSMVGAENIALVTDAMAAAGMPDGLYQLGTQEVSVADGVARLTEGGSIAGGTAHLLDVVRRTVAAGVPLHQAVLSAATVPTQVLGHSELGRPAGAIRAGHRATLLRVGPDLRGAERIG